MERHARAAEARAELSTVVADLVTRFGLQKKEIAAAIGLTDPAKLSWMLSPKPPRPTTAPPPDWRRKLSDHLEAKGGEMAEHARSIAR